jgi:hypothetical protein
MKDATSAILIIRTTSLAGLMIRAFTEAQRGRRGSRSPRGRSHQDMEAARWQAIKSCRNIGGDLADRAYASAIKFGGETVEILNNQGYSYMLRGDYPAARNNPTVLNKLKLLDGSTREIRRTPDFESTPE